SSTAQPSLKLPPAGASTARPVRLTNASGRPSRSTTANSPASARSGTPSGTVADATAGGTALASRAARRSARSDRVASSPGTTPARGKRAPVEEQHRPEQLEILDVARGALGNPDVAAEVDAVAGRRRGQRADHVVGVGRGERLAGRVRPAGDQGVEHRVRGT